MVLPSNGNTSIHTLSFSTAPTEATLVHTRPLVDMTIYGKGWRPGPTRIHTCGQCITDEGDNGTRLAQ